MLRNIGDIKQFIHHWQMDLEANEEFYKITNPSSYEQEGFKENNNSL